MGKLLELRANDGHALAAYRADPLGPPRGGLVILQEIFGVNSHMRAVTDLYAANGYIAIAPALFDRAQRKVELGYSQTDIAAGRDIRAKIELEGSLADIEAAKAAIAGNGKIGVIGYCWGGSLAWFAATRLKFDCAVCYYGGMITQHRTERAHCPVMMHFGDRDQSIPQSDVRLIREAQPEVTIYRYDAGHGFNCDQRKDYDTSSAAVALQRTVDFLSKHIG
jgi:carboxymethylenebutenolidase